MEIDSHVNLSPGSGEQRGRAEPHLGTWFKRPASDLTKQLQITYGTRQPLGAALGSQVFPGLWEHTGFKVELGVGSERGRQMAGL